MLHLTPVTKLVFFEIIIIIISIITVYANAQPQDTYCIIVNNYNLNHCIDVCLDGYCRVVCGLDNYPIGSYIPCYYSNKNS